MRDSVESYNYRTKYLYNQFYVVLEVISNRKNGIPDSRSAEYWERHLPCEGMPAACNYGTLRLEPVYL